jgi:hypothetical protein
MKLEKNKYIYYNKKRNNYRIIKRINGELEYFGSFRTKKEALEELKIIQQANWDFNEYIELTTGVTANV